MADEDPVAVLERWVEHGANYRVIELGPDGAVVELRTCHGEPVDRLASSDRRLIEHLTAQLDSAR